jgi:hypothetical protein
VRHDVKEFLYVVAVIAILIEEFFELFKPCRGNSAYYDATMGHNMLSISQEDVNILSVTLFV